MDLVGAVDQLSELRVGEAERSRHGRTLCANGVAASRLIPVLSRIRPRKRARRAGAGFFAGDQLPNLGTPGNNASMSRNEIRTMSIRQCPLSWGEPDTSGSQE
jgi:hypothetical protein